MDRSVFVSITAVLILILNTCTVTCSVSCLDHNGKPVDWFMAYKLPKIKDGDPVAQEGVKFYYLDARNPQWQVSPTPLDKKNQPIAFTIEQVYGKMNVMHLMYNDQKPSGKESQTHGHTKGVIAFDSKAGFWLVHSVPKFPDKRSYSFPGRRRNYGQTFLCMTLPTKTNLDKIVHQLTLTYPFIYSSNVPKFAQSDALQSVLDGDRSKTSQGSLVTLKTAGGQEFHSFAKAAEYGKDLYSEWLAPWVESDVYAETWTRGSSPPLPSTCDRKYKVMNVRVVSFGQKMEFSQTKDHSKWAVAEKAPWTCVSGINRVESQKRRPGVIVCLKNVDVNKSFMRIINQADECKKCSRFNINTRAGKFDKLRR